MTICKSNGRNEAHSGRVTENADTMPSQKQKKTLFFWSGLMSFIFQDEQPFSTLLEVNHGLHFFLILHVKFSCKLYLRIVQVSHISPWIFAVLWSIPSFSTLEAWRQPVLLLEDISMMNFPIDCPHLLICRLGNLAIALPGSLQKIQKGAANPSTIHDFIM